MKRVFGLIAGAVSLGFALQGYDFSDNVPPSQDPPGGLKPHQVPQFVVIGFDDNAYSGDSVDQDGVIHERRQGMRWLRNFYRDLKNPSGNGNAATYDSDPARTSFYMTTYYMSGENGDNPALVRQAAHDLYADGHEMGNHTESHGEALKGATGSVWDTELKTCNEWLIKPLSPKGIALYEQAQSTEYGPGIQREDITGFRTPFLAYGGDLFPTLKANGIAYDCSIEEGGQYDQDGTNYLWPYTLDGGSPGHETQHDWGNGKDFQITNTPGLWELPNHMMVIPPDDKCADYGVDHSIIAMMMEKMKWFTADSKYTGFDWNFWSQAKFSKAESIAILKYNLDLRLQGNRAPLMWGAHSGNFTSHKDNAYKHLTTRERQEVVEEFIKYALTKPEVRVVPGDKIIEWCRNPIALDDIHYRLSNTICIDTVELTGGCSATDWDETKRYEQPGATVQYNGHTYESNGWNYENIGVTPDSNSAFWKDLGPCGGYDFVKGGTVSIVGDTVVRKGEPVTVRFTPESGREVVRLWVNGEAVSPAETFTISSMSENVEVAVSFTEGGTVNTIAEAQQVQPTSLMRLGGMTPLGLNLSVPQAGAYTIELYGINGRLLQSREVALDAGLNQLPMGNLAPSIGVVQVFGMGEAVTKRMRF